MGMEKLQVEWMGWHRSCRRGSSPPWMVLVASPSPLAMGLGKAVQLGTRYGGWACVIVAGQALFLHCPQPPCTDGI